MKRIHTLLIVTLALLVGVTIGFYGFVYANPDNAIRIASGDILLESGSIQLDNGNFNVTGNFFVNGTSGMVLAKGGFASMLWDVDGGHWETAKNHTEYYSPNQHGGIYGTVYRVYYNSTLPSFLTSGNNVSALIDYANQIQYSGGSPRGLGHGGVTAKGTSDSHLYTQLSGGSGSGNLSIDKTNYALIQGWVDYTKP